MSHPSVSLLWESNLNELGFGFYIYKIRAGISLISENSSKLSDSVILSILQSVVHPEPHTPLLKDEISSHIKRTSSYLIRRGLTSERNTNYLLPAHTFPKIFLFFEA